MNSRKSKGGGNIKLSYCCYLGSLLVYFLSFITGFSIGLYVLFGAILLLLFGFAFSLKLLSKGMNISIVIFVVSYVVWYPLVHYVDDYYIFYPFTFFM